MSERAASLTILDGGIGHLLKQRGIKTSVADTEWADTFLVAALANAEAPDAVQQIHADYIAAGADVVTVNNFSVTPWSTGRIGRQDSVKSLTLVSHQQQDTICRASSSIADVCCCRADMGWPTSCVPAVAENHSERVPVQAAVAVARAAADAAAAGGKKRPLIAGSLPPLGESYATAGGQRAAELAQPIYAQIAALLAPEVDLLLCETMALSHEAWAAASAAAATGLPVWVSLTLEDSSAGRLRSGESLADVAAKLAALPGVEAVLLNCSAPQAISAALPALRLAAAEPVRIGAYGNAFQRTTSEWLSSEHQSSAPQLERDPGEYDANGCMTPEAYAKHAADWVAAGASIIGGCCGIGPNHIRAVASHLRNQ